MGTSSVTLVGEKPDNGTKQKLKASKRITIYNSQTKGKTPGVINTMHSKNYQNYNNKAR